MRKVNQKWRRALLSFLLAGTILAQMIAGTGIGETMQVAAKEMEEVELTDENRYGEKFCGQPKLFYPAAEEIAAYAVRAAATLEDFIVEALKAGETTVDVSSYQLPVSDSGEYAKIIKNHPELFYISQSYRYSIVPSGGNQIVGAFQAQYIDGVDQDNAASMSAAMEAEAEAAAACAESDMEPYEKALAVHDYLIQNCKYDYANYLAGEVPELSHTAYGALVNGQAVCDGYAGAYLYIMRDKLGIDCRIVTSEDMAHAWNMIELDGQWYHADLTWDDPVWDCMGRVCHDNFLLSDDAVSGGSPDAALSGGGNHYGWDRDVSADSDTYDGAFWGGVTSAILRYDDNWYYSKFQMEGDDVSTAVKLIKTENLLDGAGKAIDTAPAWSGGSGYDTSSFMFLVRYEGRLYYNTQKEIRRVAEGGYLEGTFRLQDISLEGKQVFGFSMKDGYAYWVPAESYDPGVEQTEIMKSQAGSGYMDFTAPVESGMVDSPSDGKYSYIYFGSYPQTEVKGSALTDAIINADYNVSGDARVDGEKYRRIYTKRIPYGTFDGTDQYFYYKWEPIRWRVLEKTDEKLLVMADLGLDYVTYHTEDEGVTWQDSQMRDWLNNEETETLSNYAVVGKMVYEPEYYMTNQYFPYYFYSCGDGDTNTETLHYIKDDRQEKVRSFYTTAFGYNAQQAIVPQGDDKIFLLTADDARNTSYGFGTADTPLDARKLTVSDYARKKRFYAGSDAWLLRAADGSQTAALVGTNGDIIENNEAFKVNTNLVAVAPALYIKTDSNVYTSGETMILQERASAINTLENYRSEGLYRKAERKMLAAAVADGKAAIKQAGSVSDIHAALEDAIGKIAELKTDSDYRKEERGDLDTMELNPVHHCNADGAKDTTDWKYIYFGSAPQTKVTDEALIELLDGSFGAATSLGGLYNPFIREVTLNGEKYMEMSMTGDWYKCEPVKWRILKAEEDDLFVMADSPILLLKYASYVNADWNSSEVKSFLNEAFLENAFDGLEREAIVPVQIDGQECSVYLLTKEEATNEEYGFCSDGTKASASRHVEANDCTAGIWDWWGRFSPTIKAGGGRIEDGWWLRGEVEVAGNDTKQLQIVNSAFNPNTDNSATRGSIELCSPNYSDQYPTAMTKAEVVPALRVSKSSGYWSFKPESGSRDPAVLEQAIEDAKRELETSYSEEDYSEEAWAKVLAAIETAKTELEDSDSTGDVKFVLNDAKEEIAKIPTKEQEEALKRLEKEGLSNPKHTHVLTDGAVAEGDEDKDVTEWSYVYFGSYPQSRVRDAKITAAVDAAIEAGEADSVDTGIESYIEIYDADVDGEKYRRLKITKIGEGDEVITTYYKWEPIKWKILQIENETHSLYLMADQKIEYRQMDREVNNVTWRDSDLREWLNQGFFASAFSNNEQKAVLAWQTLFPDADHGNAPGVADDMTEDKVSLLSYNELYQEKYGFCPLHDNRGNGNSRPVSSRQQTQTDYQRGLVQALPGMHKSHLDDILAGNVDKVLKYYQDVLGFESFDASRKDSGSGQFTWTRSPGHVNENQTDFARTFAYGYVCPVGGNAFFKQGVVPVLHVDFSSGLWKTELGLKKDAAKAELAAYKADDSSYYEAQQEERRAIREEGNLKIENAEDETAIADALREAKEKLDGVPTIGEIKLKEWEEKHPDIENLKNPVVTGDPEGNSAEYSYVYFGSYPQSVVSDESERAAVGAAMADMENGKDAWVQVDGVKKKYRKYKNTYFRWEPIKWRVLQKEAAGDGETASLLLMADNGLDAKKFHESGYADWKDSTLRAWLTTDFYNEAFNLTQQEAMICPVQANNEEYLTSDPISLPSNGDLLKEEYGFSKSATALGSRAVSPSGYASAITYNARMWWQNSTVESSSRAWLTMQDGSMGMTDQCDKMTLACVPVARVNLFTEGAYALNPEELKAGQGVTEEVPEKLDWFEELIADYDEADRAALEDALAQAREAIENAGGDAKAMKDALAALEQAFEDKTEETRTRMRQELGSLEQGIDKNSYYEAQQKEIEEALQKAERAIEDASDVKAIKAALDEAKQAVQKVKTKAEVDQAINEGRTEAKNKLEAYRSEDALAKYDEEDQGEIRAIIEKALADIDDAADEQAIQDALAQAEEQIKGIRTTEQKQLSSAKDEAKRELDAYLTDENKALYREAEWKALTNAVQDAMGEIEDAGDTDAVRDALAKLKTAVAAIKTDAQLKEEETKKPDGSITSDPEKTDPGKTDPGKTDPETPVLEKGDSVVKGNLKFVVLDPEKKTASVEGAAAAKKKKFAVSVPPVIEINGNECKVTEVKKKGFAKFAKITKVTLGKNVTKVGKNAFDGCKAVTSLTVNGDVKTFDAKSFNGCKKLKTITFKGKKVPAFKSGAFKGTASKVKVKLAKMSKKNKDKVKKQLKKAGVKKVS